MLQKSASSAVLFVSYLVFGLLALFALIVGLKATQIAGIYTTLYLGAGIFVTNLVVVLGYTFAVLRSPDSLKEADSADLAYYLGFCLTVGALSATFITDTALSQLAKEVMDDISAAAFRSDLIQGSLVQFGVGLTATLIGLCAKIFIASRQALDNREPEELYREFRVQIGMFEQEMSRAAQSYTRTVAEKTADIDDTFKRLSRSLENVTSTALNTNKAIVERLSVDVIARPIEELETQIQVLAAVSKAFASRGGEIANHLKSVTESVLNVSSTLNDLQGGVSSLVESVDHLRAGLAGLSVDTSDAGAGMKTLRLSINGAAAESALLTEKYSSLGSVVTGVNTTLEQSKVSISELSQVTQGSVAALSLVKLGSSELKNELTNVSVLFKRVASEARTIEEDLFRLKEGLSSHIDEAKTLRESLKSAVEDLKNR